MDRNNTGADAPVHRPKSYWWVRRLPYGIRGRRETTQNRIPFQCPPFSVFPLNPNPPFRLPPSGDYVNQRSPSRTETHRVQITRILAQVMIHELSGRALNHLHPVCSPAQKAPLTPQTI